MIDGNGISLKIGDVVWLPVIPALHNNSTLILGQINRIIETLKPGESFISLNVNNENYFWDANELIKASENESLIYILEN
jgi:hypothetical protein